MHSAHKAVASSDALLVGYNYENKLSSNDINVVW